MSSEQPDGMFTKKSFSNLVQERVKKDRSTYLEAIIEICKERMIDPEDIVKLRSEEHTSELQSH